MKTIVTMKARFFFAITLRASLLLLLTLFLTASDAYATEVPFPTEHTLSSTFSNAVSVMTADVDQDGDLDVLGAAWGDNDITWWENVSSSKRATGESFIEHTVEQDFDGAHSVMAADVDGDGDLDILGAADLANQIAWWENSSGDGSTWTEHTVDDNFDGPRSIYAADLDGDGDQDILGAALRLGGITWWENSTGDGSAWNEQPVNEDFAGAESVHAGDIDSDGDLDILGASFSGNSITWWENSAGDGSTWDEHTLSAEFGGAQSALAVDMDQDGDLDVLGAGSKDQDIIWWENVTGDGSTWSSHAVDQNFDGAISARAADIDMDGDLDILGAGYGADDITWWENTTGDSQSWSQHTIDENFDNARSVYAADVDHDGDLDVLGAAFDDNAITWWENESIHRNAVFYDSLQSLGTSDSFAVAVGDVDSDGDLDAFIANWSQSNIVWLNDGTGTLSQGQSLASSESTDVALADLDHDGDLDAFVTNTQANKIWLNDGSGLFTANGQELGSSQSWAVALEDLDGDGDLDAYVANWGQGNKVWLNDGNALFTDSGQSLGNSDSLNVALADLDGDGDRDAFVTNINDQANQVWLNNGSAVFTASGQSLGSSHSEGVALGDIDSDGDIDAFVTNHTANKIWLNNGNGTFTDSGQSLGSSISLDVALADVDNDGSLDAFVVNNGDQSNKVWLNDGTGTFTDSGQTLGSSDSVHVALADIDSDGDLDALVANWGQGNKVWLNQGGQVAFESSDTAPTTLSAGQQDDMLQLVATHKGRSGDHNAELVTLELLFEETADDPLTSAEANALIANLHIYLDEGSGTFDGSESLRRWER